MINDDNDDEFDTRELLRVLNYHENLHHARQQQHHQEHQMNGCDEIQRSQSYDNVGGGMLMDCHNNNNVNVLSRSASSPSFSRPLTTNTVRSQTTRIVQRKFVGKSVIVRTLAVNGVVEIIDDHNIMLCFDKNVNQCSSCSGGGSLSFPPVLTRSFINEKFNFRSSLLTLHKHFDVSSAPTLTTVVLPLKQYLQLIHWLLYAGCRLFSSHKRNFATFGDHQDVTERYWERVTAKDDTGHSYGQDVNMMYPELECSCMRRLKLEVIPVSTIRGLLRLSVHRMTFGDDDVAQYHRLLRRVAPDLSSHLMSYQSQGVSFGVSTILPGRVLIGDEMGLGKTIQAIALAATFHTQWPLLVVVPAPMRLVWSERIERWLPNIPPTQIYILDSSASFDPACLTATITITSPQMLYNQRVAIFKQRFRVVIVDESHVISCKAFDTDVQGGGSVAGTLGSLVKQAKHAILLSGTPALSNPSHMWGQIASLGPYLGSYNDFSKNYCVSTWKHVGQSRTIYSISGGYRLTELSVLLRQCVMIRRTKNDVLLELPCKRRQIVLMDCNNSDDEVVVDSVGKYQQLGLRKLPGVKRYLNHVIDKIRHQYESFQTVHKLVVFAHHVSVMDAIHNELVMSLNRGERRPHLQCVRFDGSTECKDRIRALDMFEKQAHVCVALVSVTAGGQGVDMSCAHTAIFAEIPRTLSTFQQAEGRVHRIRRGSQYVNVDIVVLCAKGTWDEEQWHTLNQHLAIVNESYNGQATQPVHLSVSNVVDVEAACVRPTPTRLPAASVGDVNMFFACSSQSQRNNLMLSFSVHDLPTDASTSLNVLMEKCEEHMCASADLNLRFVVSRNTRRVHVLDTKSKSLGINVRWCDMNRNLMVRLFSCDGDDVEENGMPPCNNENRRRSDTWLFLSQVSRLVFESSGVVSASQRLYPHHSQTSVSRSNTCEYKSIRGVSAATIMFAALWDTMKRSMQSMLYGRLLSLEQLEQEIAALVAPRLVVGDTFERYRSLDSFMSGLCPHLPCPLNCEWRTIVWSDVHAYERCYRQPFSCNSDTGEWNPVCLMCHSVYEREGDEFFPSIEDRSVSQHEALGRYYQSEFFCNLACYTDCRSRTSGRNLRREVSRVQHGVCQVCNWDVHDTYIQLRHLQPPARRVLLETLERNLSTDFIDQLCAKQALKEGDMWHADHIVAVKDGGGSCGIENMRTLCVPCHRSNTRAQRRRWALQRRHHLTTARNHENEKRISHALLQHFSTDDGDAFDTVHGTFTEPSSSRRRRKKPRKNEDNVRVSSTTEGKRVLPKLCQQNTITTTG